MRLDSYESYPSGMRDYLSYYGWHFSKKMCDWAISNMYKEEDGNRTYIQKLPKEHIDNMLTAYGIKLNNNKGYDYVYVANMCNADFMNSSIKNDQDLFTFIKDYIDDSDAYEGMPFTRFYADCIGSGTPIQWEDMI